MAIEDRSRPAGDMPDWDAEEDAAWRALVDGYRDAIACLSLDHPERPMWVHRLRTAAHAAGVEVMDVARRATTRDASEED